MKNNFRVCAALFFAVLVFSAGLVFCSSAESGLNFAQSAEFYRRGKYKEAMLGFMDVLIKEPGNAAAMQNLKSAGAMLAKREKGNAAEEKGNLVREAEELEAWKERLDENKRVRLKKWKGVYSRVLKLASSPDTLKEAVTRYEAFLKNAPVYSDVYERFVLNNGAIKKKFYETMKSKYPLFLQDKVSIDSRDLATLFFAEGSENDSPSRYVNSQGAEQMLYKAREIEELEKETEARYKTAADAFRFYSNAKYEVSLGFWNQLLAKEQSNEEAIFYRDLAEKEIRAVSALPNAARLYEQGVREFSAGNYAAAVKSWRGCIRLEPGNKKAELGIEEALKLMRGGNPERKKPDEKL